MSRTVLALCIAAAAMPVARAETPILPFEQVRPGMTGHGRTVFAGTEISTFEVEILGTLPNIGPKQNLILGRCSGEPLTRTGVLAGMSGSPVYVDGKLIGAVAYSWGFAKDAIAGITPIEEMLAVAQRTSERSERASGGVTPQDLALLDRPEGLSDFYTRRAAALAPAPVAGYPFQLPLAVSGLGARGLTAISPALREAGFLPVQGGGAGRDPAPAGPAEPGSAIGLKFARGDVDFTATGTVTWVDGDRVLAFGHPLFGLGEVELPLTGARVEALMPNLNQSMRLATPLGELGTLYQDRTAGVLGRLGPLARMIPVRLQFSGSSGRSDSYSFDIADDALLAPLLLYSALNGILANSERAFGNITVRLAEGSVIKLEGRDDVALDNVFVGPTAPLYATGTSAFILHLLMNNDWARTRVAGINLILAYDDRPRTARIRRLTLNRYRVRAGEAVDATIVIAPYRGPEQALTREIRIPADTPPGRLSVHVGGAMTVARAAGVGVPLFPRDLDQLIRLINQLRRNDRVYLLATREDLGVFLGGARMPNLPPSVGSILSRPHSAGNFAVIRQRELLEESIPTGYAVDGLARVMLEVVAP